MLTLIHGDDIASSRNYLQSVKEANKPHEVIDGDKADFTEIMQLFDGGGLFEEKKTLFLENLISKKKNTIEYDTIISYLEKKANENEIYLWENKEVEKTQLNTFKKHAVKHFSYPQTLFQFLDAIKPNNSTYLVKLFHTTVQTTEAEIVFFMLTRHIRMLLVLHTASDAQIDETRRLAPWQKTKLIKQAKNFTLNKLIELHTRLFEIDKGIKTGSLQLPLISAIDFFLVEV